MRIALFFLFTSCQLWGQSVYLDQPLKFGKVEFFPSASEAHAFYYLPAEIRLAHHPDGTPKFYFHKFDGYSLRDSSRMSRAPIGVVQLEVELATDRFALDSAWNALKATHPEAVLKGPMDFDTSRLKIISSVIGVGGLAWQSLCAGSLLRVGDAATVSVVLKDVGTKILWMTFETATPDLSLGVEWVKNGLVASGKNASGSDLKSVKPGSRTFRTDWNIGRLQCPSCFDSWVSPIDESLFRTRDIYILNEQFSKGLDTTIAFVTVQMRKTHESGEMTIDEYRLLKLPTLKDYLKHRLQYGWKSDTNGPKWLKYQYRILWTFKNWTTTESAWIDSNMPVIFLKFPSQ